jgi:hypothetical protein
MRQPIKQFCVELKRDAAIALAVSMGTFRDRDSCSALARPMEEDLWRSKVDVRAERSGIN